MGSDIEAGAREPLARQLNLRLFGMSPIEQQRIAEDLRQLTAGLFGKQSCDFSLVDDCALADADLDQLVVFERLIDCRD